MSNLDKLKKIELINLINTLNQQILDLNERIDELRNKLTRKNDLSTERTKRYYQRNKEKCIAKSIEYQKTHDIKRKPIDPEKRKEYARRAYLKRKEKLKEYNRQRYLNFKEQKKNNSDNDDNTDSDQTDN